MSSWWTGSCRGAAECVLVDEPVSHFSWLALRGVLVVVVTQPEFVLEGVVVVVGAVVVVARMLVLA